MSDAIQREASHLHEAAAISLGAHRVGGRRTKLGHDAGTARPRGNRG